MSISKWHHFSNFVEETFSLIQTTLDRFVANFPCIVVSLAEIINFKKTFSLNNISEQTVQNETKNRFCGHFYSQKDDGLIIN